MFLFLSVVSAVVLTVLYSSIVIFLYKQKSGIHMAFEIVKCRAKENSYLHACNGSRSVLCGVDSVFSVVFRSLLSTQPKIIILSFIHCTRPPQFVYCDKSSSILPI